MKFELKLEGLTGYYLWQEIDEDDRKDCGIEIIEIENEDQTETKSEFYFSYNDNDDLNCKLSNILNILLDK